LKLRHDRVQFIAVFSIQALDDQVGASLNTACISIHRHTHIYIQRESISKMLGQLSRVSSRHQNKEKNHSNIFPQTGFEAEIPRLPVSNP